MNLRGMEVFRSLEQAKAAGSLRGCVVAIGNLDGVHLGHQRLLAVVEERARALGARPAVLTFDPHPVRVLRPQLAPPLVTPLSRKLELFAAYGIDGVVVQPFDVPYAATPAAEFVSRDLSDRLGCAEVVVGYDFTAGHERARVDVLRGLLAARGITLHVVDPVTSDGLVVSSTKVREFLLEGNVQAAALLLTRPHDVDGIVVRGAGRGRGLGFPTANVATGALLPANGVYVIRASVGGGAPGKGPVRGGVSNVGVKPTVEASAGVGLEVHLFDFGDRDLYGEPIRVAFLVRIRDERRFPSVEALRAQIGHDVARARDVLAAGPM